MQGNQRSSSYYRGDKVAWRAAVSGRDFGEGDWWLVAGHGAVGKEDLREITAAAQLLNEMLQNADDAGSSEFKVLLSARTFGTASLLSPALADMQGAALYQFDDAQFRPDDYESIQRVGDGTKLGDPTKTGQFGLGFNSVYHVTDTPMFVSGRDFVVFDPHEAHLPDGLPGLCEDASSLSRACPDQLAPFQGIFGCDVVTFSS